MKMSYFIGFFLLQKVLGHCFQHSEKKTFEVLNSILTEDKRKIGVLENQSQSDKAEAEPG